MVVPPLPAHLQSWQNELDKLIRITPKKGSVAGAKPRTRSLLDRYTTEERKSAVQNGHEIMDRMRARLDTFSRSEQQKQMHHVMLRCVAPRVYGDAIWEHELEILEYNNFTNLNKEVIVTAPRRFGKSWGVGMAS
jgi:hypothetical protein